MITGNLNIDGMDGLFPSRDFILAITVSGHGELEVRNQPVKYLFFFFLRSGSSLIRSWIAEEKIKSAVLDPDKKIPSPVRPLIRRILLVLIVAKNRERRFPESGASLSSSSLSNGLQSTLLTNHVYSK